jgi:hypothetical protein
MRASISSWLTGVDRIDGSSSASLVTGQVSSTPLAIRQTPAPRDLVGRHVRVERLELGGVRDPPIEVSSPIPASATLRVPAWER